MIFEKRLRIRIRKPHGDLDLGRKYMHAKIGRDWLKAVGGVRRKFFLTRFYIYLWKLAYFYDILRAIALKPKKIGQNGLEPNRCS